MDIEQPFNPETPWPRKREDPSEPPLVPPRNKKPTVLQPDGQKQLSDDNVTTDRVTPKQERKSEGKVTFKEETDVNPGTSKDPKPVVKNEETLPFSETEYWEGYENSNVQVGSVVHVADETPLDSTSGNNNRYRLTWHLTFNIKFF